MFMNVFSSRKLLVTSVLLTLAMACVFCKGDIPPNLLSFFEIIFGCYVAGNSTEHITTTISDFLNKPKGTDNEK